MKNVATQFEFTKIMKVTHMTRPRLFLLDPVCIMKYGHNPRSLLYFASFFESIGFDTKCVSSKHFGFHDTTYDHFQRQFEFFYSEELSINSTAPPLPPKGFNSPTISIKTEPAEQAAVWDMANFLTAHDITDKDYVFFPCVDYYSLVGILGAIARVDKNKIPKIHFRFIGVMETAARLEPNPLSHIGKLLEKIHTQTQITFSAETPPYADYLREILDVNVSWTLYPLCADLMPPSTSRGFEVSCIGSGRWDKGFDRIYSIAKLYLQKYPDDDVLFRVQNLKPCDIAAKINYIMQLYAAPNIELLPSTLSELEIENLYRDCNLLLMPYDFETYKYRGSAVLMEGIARGRQAILTACMGLHKLVDMLDTTKNCSTNMEFCNAIHESYEQNKLDTNFESKAQNSAMKYRDIATTQLEAIWPNT